MNNQNYQNVDHAALKTNQAVIIALNILAFILNAPLLAALVTLAMVLGTLRKIPGFIFIYRALISTGWIKPDILQDNPEPHQFAQGFGGVVMLIGTGALYAGASILGWALIWLVVALAALNLFVGFCVGCAVYYWLGRLSIPGFSKSPPGDTFPGMKTNVKTANGS